MNGLSKGSMPTPERNDRTASRSGFQSEDGITVAASPPPAMSASRAMPSGKTVSPARTLRKANGSEAFGGCTVEIGDFQRRREREDISGRLMFHLYAGQTPAPLAQADHAELAHVQRAEEQAVQQQAEQKIEPPRTSEAREGGEGSAKSSLSSNVRTVVA